MLTARYKRITSLLLSLSLSLLSFVGASVDFMWRSVINDAPPTVASAVENIVAFGHSIKAQFTVIGTAARSAVANFAAKHVVMLRCKGPSAA